MRIKLLLLSLSFAIITQSMQSLEKLALQEYVKDLPRLLQDLKAGKISVDIQEKIKQELITTYWQPKLFSNFNNVDTNIQGTLTLLELAKQHPVKNCVIASSSSVYGQSKKVPFVESDAVDKPCSPYAMSKRASELLAYTYHKILSMF